MTEAVGNMQGYAVRSRGGEYVGCCDLLGGKVIVVRAIRHAIRIFDHPGVIQYVSIGIHRARSI